MKIERKLNLMKKSLNKSALMAALITGNVIWGGTAVHAEEPEQIFTLDPMVVTATRTEKRDLDVPATTSVYTSKQLEDTGATTVEGALKYATGIVYKAETIGSGGGEFLIRGKRRGTLVLVNGVPLNFRTGYYDLDNISLDDVERIEIIRGGGAVLYGSDTTGGVINIITKDKLANSAKVSFGNYGKQKHSLSTQVGKLGLGANFEKMKSVDNITAPSISSNKYDSKYFNFRGGEKKIYSMNYKFDDNWKFLADFSSHQYGRSYNYANKDAAAVYDLRDLDDDEYRYSLNYKKDGWQANAFYHRRKSNTKYTYFDYASKPSAELIGILDKHYLYEYTDEVAGLDIQKELEFKNDTILLGMNVYRESYELDTKNKPKFDTRTGKFLKYLDPSHVDYARNVYSVFASLEHNFDKKHSAVLSARETWTGGTPDGSNYNEFTPQVQYLYKMNDATSLYASVGKSFTLPTMTDMYGNGMSEANPGIKPETGMHYETGIKHISGGHQWKLAIFKSDVKDFIRLKTIADTEVAMNEDTKNFGIELGCEIEGENGWSSNWGISLGNPKFYDSRYPDKGWQRSYGRVQLTGGVSYRKDKWSASLNGNYLADRVLESYQISVKPMFLTSFRTSYKPVKNHEIFLNVDNLLNRQDITSHVSSLYYSLGRNFEIGYKILF